MNLHHWQDKRVVNAVEPVTALYLESAVVAAAVVAAAVVVAVVVVVEAVVAVD